MKNIVKFINESYLDDILDKVENWFWNNCGEDGYDSSRARREDFEALIDGDSDEMVDTCVRAIKISKSDIDKYWDDIYNKLSELASKEL